MAVAIDCRTGSRISALKMIECCGRPHDSRIPGNSGAPHPSTSSRGLGHVRESRARLIAGMEMVRVRNLRRMCLFLMVAGFVMFRRFGPLPGSLSMKIDRFLRHNQTASPARGIDSDRLQAQSTTSTRGVNARVIVGSIEDEYASNVKTQDKSFGAIRPYQNK
jgi:hypothetical protein